ncbi:MAG: hypothetical protein Q9209_001365 [Squamulea sp. 1 TL-2023]
MRPSLADYLLSSVLLALVFAAPVDFLRRQYLNGSPEYYVANANITAVGSANELNQDTQPLPQINSTYLPAALTKALQLNFTDAISRFHRNGTYKNTLELPDIESKNFTGCRYWPQIGQRIQIQVFKWFTSKTSTSELSFWVHDPSHGFYEHCINNALPGWNLLQTYVMSPCLNDNITWELQGTDASTLVIREYIECRGRIGGRQIDTTVYQMGSKPNRHQAASDMDRYVLLKCQDTVQRDCLTTPRVSK